MSSYVAASGYTPGTGYTCTFCKTWVAFGSSHSCPGRAPVQQVDLRLITALERLAAAIERANEIEETR